MSKLWNRARLRRALMLGLALGLAAGASSCNKSGSSIDHVGIRMVHTSTDLGDVDVYVRDYRQDGSDMLIFLGILYNQVTGYAQIEPGTYILDFRAADSAATSAPLFSSDPVTFVRFQNRITAVIAGLRGSASLSDQIRLLPLVEDFSPNEFPLARVRFCNSTADAPPLFIDVDSDGNAEDVPGLERFVATDAAGANLPVLDLDITLMSGDPLAAFDSFQFTGLNRDDQFFLVTTGLLNGAPGQEFQFLVIGRKGLVSTVRSNPLIYVANCGPDNNNIDFTIDGDLLAEDLLYRAIAGPFQVAPGTHSILAANALPFGMADVSLIAGSTYIAVAGGLQIQPGNAPTVTVLEDQFVADPINATIRLGNFVTDGAILAIDFGFLESSDQIEQPPLFEALNFGSASLGSGLAVPEGTDTYGVADTGNTTRVQDFDITLTMDLRAFLFVMGSLPGAPGVADAQVLQIITNTTPWSTVVIDAN